MPGSSSVAWQISPIDRSTSLPTETSPAKWMPRALPRDRNVPIMPPECDAAKMRPTGRSGSSKAALAVRNVLCRRSTTPRLDGPTRRVPESFRSCLIRVSRAVPSAPVSLKPLASAVTTGTPMRAHSSISSLGGVGRLRLGGTLVEAAVEHVLGDAVLQHLDRAAGDHPAAAAPHAIFDERRLAIAGRAHDLHRLVRDLEAGLIAGGLRHRGLIGRRQPFVGVGGSAIKQKLRALEFDRHVGELPLQALEFGERPAELLAHAGVLARPVVAIAAERQRPRGVAE